MFKKKYFISYACFDENGLRCFANGTTETRKMTLEVINNFSREICEMYGHKNIVVLNFQKIK